MSRSPWQVLGIEPGADARTIKRAYARLLKEVRPDVDPERFQWVRWAYEQALARNGADAAPSVPAAEPDVRDERDDGDVVEAPPIARVAPRARADAHAPPVLPTPVAAVVPLRAVEDVALPQFRPAQVVCEALRDALFAGKDAIAQALAASPELTSLVERPAIEDGLLRLLLDDARVPERHAFDVLAAWFHWYEIGVGQRRLRDREAPAFDRYLRRIAGYDELKLRIEAGNPRRQSWIDATSIRFLLTPWMAWKWIFLLVPRTWRSVFGRLEHIRMMYGRVVDTVLDPTSLRRIERMADRLHVREEQVLVVLWRWVIASVVALAVVYRVEGMSGGQSMWQASKTIGTMLLAYEAARLAYHWVMRGVRALRRWISDRVIPAVRAHWWALPTLRVLLASLLPAAGRSWGEGEWALYNAGGMVLLACTARETGLALLDVVGALLWSVAMRATLDWPASDMGAMLALGYVVAAVMRELALWGAHVEDGDDIQLPFARRGLAQLAAPVALWIAMSYLRS